MKKLIVLVALVGAGVATAGALPDIKRYLKMRAM